MRKFTYEHMERIDKIIIKERNNDIVVATYNIDNKEISMVSVAYEIDEVEEILDFIKSYEIYQERKKLIDEELVELFKDEENG